MRVAIRGLGAVSALGVGVGALRAALFKGRDGLRAVTRFDPREVGDVTLGGCVEAGESCEAWAVDAAREAWADAAIDVDPRRVAVVAGTTEGEGQDPAGIARAVAEAIGARGPRWTISTACTSSANAIGLGMDLLARGDADVVIAGGAERLLPEMFAGFHRLGVLSAAKCAPFGASFGTTLGEGAGFVVLARGAPRGWGWLHGYGLASDAFHETSPDPRGAGVARAIRGALGDAGLPPEAIGYVNAHGTGTAANDDAEHRGVRAALGERAVPISSTKSFLGHAQGAAGALELIATLVCLREGTIPPTLRVGAGRPGGPADPVAGEAPRASDARAFVSTSAAFGGADAVLCAGLDPTEGAVHLRRVHVRGASVVDAPEVRGFDLRNTDPSARIALAAALGALDDATIHVRGALRERAGIFGGATRVSPASLAEYRDSIERGGLARCSAAAFARLVMHAPVGAVSRLLALRGPTTTLAAEGCAGLLAVIYAADHLARRDDADVLVAVGLDETEDATRAAALVVACEGPGPVVTASATGGPGSMRETIAAALARAGRRGDEVAAWHVLEGPISDTPSERSARLAVDAARAVREGAAVAVAAARDRDVTCAVVLEEDRWTRS